MRYQQGIWLPDKDTASFWSDEYEKRDYNKLNLSGDVCLDIGAHVGIWTKRLSEPVFLWMFSMLYFLEGNRT